MHAPVPSAMHTTIPQRNTDTMHRYSTMTMIPPSQIGRAPGKRTHLDLGLVRKQPLRAIGLMKQLCNSIRHGNRRA
jgi:hypothetical protein